MFYPDIVAYHNELNHRISGKSVCAAVIPAMYLPTLTRLAVGFGEGGLLSVSGLHPFRESIPAAEFTPEMVLPLPEYPALSIFDITPAL